MEPEEIMTRMRAAMSKFRAHNAEIGRLADHRQILMTFYRLASSKNPNSEETRILEGRLNENKWFTDVATQTCLAAQKMYKALGEMMDELHELWTSV
jgi:hypothetical protein